MGNQDFTSFGSAFQAAGQIHLATDDGVIHAHVSTEVAYGAVTGTQPHAYFQRPGNALAAPLLTQHFHVLAHGYGHGDGSFCVLFGAPADRVTKKHHDAVTDELINGATVLQSN